MNRHMCIRNIQKFPASCDTLGWVFWQWWISLMWFCVNSWPWWFVCNLCYILAPRQNKTSSYSEQPAITSKWILSRIQLPHEHRWASLAFEFLYILTYCGIRVHECLLVVLIEGSITYDLVHLDFTGHISVSCYLQRRFLINIMMERREDNSHKSKRTVGQKCSMSCEAE
jgi:hypothetical protein